MLNAHEPDHGTLNDYDDEYEELRNQAENVVNLIGDAVNLTGDAVDQTLLFTYPGDPELNFGDSLDESLLLSSSLYELDQPSSDAESKPLKTNSPQQLPSNNCNSQSFPANSHSIPYNYNAVPNPQCAMFGHYNPMNLHNNLSGLPHCISGYCAANDYIPVGLSKFKEFLQYKISGDRNIRFNKEKLHALYKIFQEKCHWEKLTRKEMRKKDLVFFETLQI